jgi:uncharacterized membrane protein YkgB
MSPVFYAFAVIAAAGSLVLSDIVMLGVGLVCAVLGILTENNRGRKSQ